MRRFLIGLTAIAIGALILAFVYRAELIQLHAVNHLFDEEQIVHNFQNMNDVFAFREVAAGGAVLEFERGDYTLPTHFEYEGKSFETRAFIENETATTGLLILHRDRIMYERYDRGHSELTRHIAWSVSKSVLSALFGVAVAEGDIRDIMQPVTDYVPELVGSGYDGVPIKHVLQMSSGVAFDEDYGDPDSDINRMGRVLALGQTLLDFAASLERARPPGTLQHYVSIDTQVLGTILVRATGQNLAEYTSQKLWVPVGMESNAYWATDGSGMEMAFGGLNTTLRDLARFGRLYLNGGNWNGAQIIPADWVEDSVTPDAPHLMPGPKPETDNEMGYGYQWWIPAASQGDFLAIGVYNQYVYVDPNHDLVIAKHSVNRDFQRNNFEPTRETLALFRKIASDLEEGEPHR